MMGMASSVQATRERLFNQHEPAHAVIGPDRIVLTHILRPEINLTVWQRKMPDAIAAWVSTPHARDCFSGDIDTKLDANDVAAAITSEVSAHDPLGRAGVTALAQDAGELAALIAQMSRSRAVRLRLEWVKQQCPNFHADRVPIRLLCTYRGAGTEWLANDVADELKSPDHIPPTSAINRLGTGHVAILKGTLGILSTGPLRHRSPAATKSDEWRLLLALDPAGRGA